MICMCECHESMVELLHLFPCCHRCPYCGQRIVAEHYDKHLEVCKLVYVDIVKKWQKELVDYGRR